MGDKNNETKKVLVVDDEVALLDILLEKFTREGFTALGAKDGAEGIEMSLKEQPDVILLDLVMPNVTGMDVFKKVRESGAWGEKVPIVVLTNLTINERLQGELLKYKPAYCLIKGDWKIEEVVEKVESALGGGKKQE